MQGSIDHVGQCVLRWDTQVEKLYSPDGAFHLLPCDHCGDPCWVALNTVSVVCERCYAGVVDTEEAS